MRLVFFTLAVAATLMAQQNQGDNVWRRNAYWGEGQTFDSCVGHQPNNGQYHHHANPICLRAQLNDNVEAARSARTGTVYREKPAPWTHSPILGWAIDGYPIYGPYGYAEARNAGSSIRRMRSSFRLRTIAARTTLPDWALPGRNVSATLNTNQYGPAIDNRFPLGRYIEDYEYVEGLGDLDVNNGRFAVTPEFPQGTYAYYVTVGDNGLPAFPYILGHQYQGTASGGRAQTVPAEAQEFTGTAAQAAPSLTAWLTRNNTQPARIVSPYDPSAGTSTTWPLNVPAGARTSGSVTSPVNADVQRIRYTDSTVYVNAPGLASYTMGPWLDPLMTGGVFSNFPSNQNVQMQFPRTPAAAATRTAPGLGANGLWVNGVAVFNYLDGGSYSNASGDDVGGGLVRQTAVQVSAASQETGPAAAGSIVTAYSLFGAQLATSTQTAASPEGTSVLGGATVTVRDAAGASRQAQIFYASPLQVNYRVPPETAAGFATVTFAAGGNSYTSNMHVLASYPSLVIGNVEGAASGYLTRVRGGQQFAETIGDGITIGADEVYLVLYGSGLGSGSEVKATIGGVEAQVAYAGPQGTTPGLDQYNILIPRALAGRGKVEVVVSASGRPSNAVTIDVR